MICCMIISYDGKRKKKDDPEPQTHELEPSQGNLKITCNNTSKLINPRLWLPAVPHQHRHSLSDLEVEPLTIMIYDLSSTIR